MVRLKVAGFGIDPVFLDPFQFQYGAIKGAMYLKSKVPASMFQFQYGAIKGSSMKKYLLCCVEFQFQYGAIKGGLTLINASAQLGFNSSMVRLKEVDSPATRLHVKFQFQYGAIKGREVTTCLALLNSFQFQYGAIKGRKYVREGCNKEICFNSSMVRLKDYVRS